MKAADNDSSTEALLKEVETLQQQLEQERLQVKLLKDIIDIVEKDLKVPIR